jgi:hypothetical protein
MDEERCDCTQNYFRYTHAGTSRWVYSAIFAGLPVPNLRVLEDGTDRLSRNVGKYHYNLRKNPKRAQYMVTLHKIVINILGVQMQLFI